MAFFIVIAVKTSNLTYSNFCWTPIIAAEYYNFIYTGHQIGNGHRYQASVEFLLP
jgi:hypothetical protein